MKQRYKYIIVALLSSLTTLLVLFFGLKFMFKLSDTDVTNLGRLAIGYQAATHAFVHPVDNDKIAAAGISGMLAALEDPHSVYLDQEKYSELLNQTNANFTGIGVILGENIKTKKFTVIEVLKDAPSAKAGVQEGDIILAVDGKSTENLTLEDVVKLVKGPENTNVTLTVLTPQNEKKDITITRAKLDYPTVKGKMLDGKEKIGYIAISTFSENTAKQFEEELTKLKQEGAKGLIIDLRNNPGGLLHSVVEIGQQILPAGQIVSVIDRSGNRTIYESKGQAELLPTVALINGYSASAAELLAGALQDTGSPLIGEKSYGKGSVQVVWPLFKNDGLKITIAKYYTPKMRSIDKVGLEPNVVISSEDVNSKVPIEKATELLDKIIQEKNAMQ